MVSAVALLACGSDPPRPAATVAGPVVPIGSGYDDVRILEASDCEALWEHQVVLAAIDALKGNDAGKVVDPEDARQLADALRTKMKTQGDAWVKRCAGRHTTGADLRCMRESQSVAGFDRCGVAHDAGVDDAGGADGAVGAASDASVVR